MKLRDFIVNYYQYFIYIFIIILLLNMKTIIKAIIKILIITNNISLSEYSTIFYIKF